MHRFLVTPDAFQGTKVILPNAVARQLYRVLRMQPGERIVVLDNTGWEMEVELTHVGRDETIGEVLEKRPVTGEPRVQITLYQSLLKRDNFEWVLQKCTEIGVAAFVPVVSQRAVARDSEGIKDSRMERWRRIIAEAVEQSHRGKLPVLRRAIGFEEAVAEAGKSDLSLIPWEEETGVDLRTALATAKREDLALASLSLFVGPEGGFAEDEIALAKSRGAVSVSLGPRILRAETAAVVVTSLVLYDLGELGLGTG